MKNNFWKEIITALVLIVLLALLWIFTHVVMPRAIIVTTLGGIVIVFALFAVFILREKARDEREGYHRLIAGRTAFLSGCFVSIVGIFFETLNHMIDIWLVATLVAMVLVKIGSRVYSDFKL